MAGFSLTMLHLEPGRRRLQLSAALDCVEFTGVCGHGQARVPAAQSWCIYQNA